MKNLRTLQKLMKRISRRLNKFYPVAVVLAVYTLYVRYQTLESLSRYTANNPLYDNNYTVLSVLPQETIWKSIVWYELWHGGLRMNAKSVNMNLCEYKQCTINFIDNRQQYKEYFHTADAVIFQGNRLPKAPPKRAHENQTFVFSTIESPMHLVFSFGGSRWLDAVNWTMTYRLDSDIPYKYGSFRHRNETTLPYKDYSQIFKQKMKEVAWLVSDCPTESKREKYVNILQRFVKVDIYGRCGSFKNCTKEEGIKCLQQIGKDYKFYLSFENSMCRDYMTEKVFVWFKMDTITVVRGARNYKNLLPDHTYVNAHRFDSIAALGKFLQKLSKDENEYIRYLKEKDKYETESMQTQVQQAYCDLCKRLHNVNNYRKTYRNVNQWWFVNACQRQVSDIH